MRWGLRSDGMSLELEADRKLAIKTGNRALRVRLAVNARLRVLLWRISLRWITLLWGVSLLLRRIALLLRWISLVLHQRVALIRIVIRHSIQIVKMLAIFLKSTGTF